MFRLLRFRLAVSLLTFAPICASSLIYAASSLSFPFCFLRVSINILLFNITTRQVNLQRNQPSRCSARNSLLRQWTLKYFNRSPQPAKKTKCRPSPNHLPQPTTKFKLAKSTKLWQNKLLHKPLRSTRRSTTESKIKSLLKQLEIKWWTSLREYKLVAEEKKESLVIFQRKWLKFVARSKMFPK